MALNLLPVKVITTVPKLELRGKKLKEAFHNFMRETHKEVGLMAQEQLETAIKLTDAVATGDLLQSIKTRLISGTGNEFKTHVGFEKPGSLYAWFANYGRDAGGFPPKAPIEKWMSARGIPLEFSRAIRIKIASEGTEGHFFIEKAEPIIERKQKSIVQKRIKEFVRNQSN